MNLIVLDIAVKKTQTDKLSSGVRAFDLTNMVVSKFMPMFSKQSKTFSAVILNRLWLRA